MAGALSESLGPIVYDLRLGASAAALSAFAEFTTELIDQLEARGDAAAELTPIIGTALAAQQRADYLGLADALEYELEPALAGLFSIGHD